MLMYIDDVSCSLERKGMSGVMNTVLLLEGCLLIVDLF